MVKNTHGLIRKGHKMHVIGSGSEIKGYVEIHKNDKSQENVCLAKIKYADMVCKRINSYPRLLEALVIIKEKIQDDMDAYDTSDILEDAVNYINEILQGEGRT